MYCANVYVCYDISIGFGRRIENFAFDNIYIYFVF